MLMAPNPSIAHFVLLFGLTFFFGLSFEELYARGGVPRPGGIRTFPLLALIGALLYLLDPVRTVPFSVGLLLLGAFLVVYYRRHIDDKDAEGRPNVTLAPVLCNLLAFTLGPLSLTAPAWIPVGATVAAVLLLAERERLHRFAWGIPVGEILTAGQFLILTGLTLPLLPRHPVTSLTTITPRQVWLALVAVCSISYVSYLLQRYVVRKGSGLWVGVLGGLYSSTAATVALARGMKIDPTASRDSRTGIVLATAVMYLRLLLVTAVFNLKLAIHLAPFLLGLSALGVIFAWGIRAMSRAPRDGISAPPPLRNPLDLVAALVFAALFVAISIASTWVRGAFGTAGVYSLAAIVGFSDIDPFVLSLAQGAVAPLPLHAIAAAILIAASSNNLLKAAYAGAFAGVRATRGAVVALAVLAAAGAALALFA